MGIYCAMLAREVNALERLLPASRVPGAPEPAVMRPGGAAEAPVAPAPVRRKRPTVTPGPLVL